MSMSDLKSLFGKLLGYWLLSGFVVMLLDLSYIALTEGFSDIIGELGISAVLERLPFPFDLIVTSQIDPLSLVLQVIILIILVVLIEERKS